MRDRFRIYAQMVPGGLMSLVILWSMFAHTTPTDFIVLPFVLSLLIGGILALNRQPIANWLLLFGSFGALAAGTVFHYLRIAFIIRNGGMERSDGYGSPLAFLLGWAATTIIFFIPGLVFSIWNGRKIIQCRRLQTA